MVVLQTNFGNIKIELFEEQAPISCANFLQYVNDGYYDNTASGRNLGGPEGWGGAITFNWEPSESTDLKWRTSYRRKAWKYVTPFIL